MDIKYLLLVLPSNLWSLTALKDVEILWSTFELAKVSRHLSNLIITARTTDILSLQE
jgi:hypothetical protein